MSEPAVKPSIAYLRLRAEGLIASLKANLQEASYFEFPGEGPGAALTAISKTLELVKEEVAQSADARTLVMCCQCIESLGSTLEYFDNAITEQTPRGLTQLLERIVTPLHPEAQFVLWPCPQYNYEIEHLRDHLSGIVEGLSVEDTETTLQSIIKSSILLVSFPRIDRDNILQHAILGHELGHPIADEYLTEEEDTDDGEDRIKRIVESAKKLSNAGADDFGEDAAIVKLILEIRKRALQELVSDAVAILLFGPSALLALYDFLMSGGWDNLPEPDEYYPPTRRRLRLALKILEEEGHLKALQDLCEGPKGDHFGSLCDRIEDIRTLVEKTSDQAHIAKNDEVSLAYSFVDESLAEALKFAKSKVASAVYKSDLLRSEVPELVDRVANNLPPNEIGFAESSSVVDPRSALLASWVWRVHCKREVDGQQIMCTAEDIDKVHKLTLRAIEYISLQNLYKSFKPGTAL